MKYIKFEFEKKYIRDFLELPKKLYSKYENTENYEETKNILLEKHPLSKYIKIDKFLIYKNNKTVARFILTKYPNDKNIYLGFFECVNDNEVAKYLFDIAYKYAKDNNYEKIIGPVNCSLWIKYRLKVNNFNKMPYTGEPFNKEYYLKLFENNKFEVSEHYISNNYNPVIQKYENEKYYSRYNKFINNGYKIISPNTNNFNKSLEEVYYLLTELYKDFPVFKNINLKDFLEIFKNYKYILNMSMVKLAYYNNKLVGFIISVPNYNNLLYNIRLYNMINIIKTKNKPKEYVILYMGVDNNHRGLGSAMIYNIINELKQNKAKVIGALIREGKVSGNYAKDLINSKYQYVLLERKIE